jgi:8-oxo-dGTP diphosphatase
MAPMLYTQVHCVDNNRVLLMKRNKEPNLGLWVAPGGKIEADESPYECAARELLEETGLQAYTMHLRGIVSVVMPALTQPSMQFLYVVTRFSGELVADEREGSLRWWLVEEALQIPKPEPISVYLSRILDLSTPFYQAKYVFDADWTLTEVIEHSTQV